MYVISWIKVLFEQVMALEATVPGIPDQGKWVRNIETGKLDRYFQ